MTSNPFIFIKIYISRKVLNDSLHSIQQPANQHKSPVRYNFTFVFQNFCSHTRIQSNGTDHWLQQNMVLQTSHTLVAPQNDNCDWCHSVIQTSHTVKSAIYPWLECALNVSKSLKLNV